jgi:hypothetical protein
MPSRCESAGLCRNQFSTPEMNSSTTTAAPTISTVAVGAMMVVEM